MRRRYRFSSLSLSYSALRRAWNCWTKAACSDVSIPCYIIAMTCRTSRRSRARASSQSPGKTVDLNSPLASASPSRYVPSCRTNQRTTR